MTLWPLLRSLPRIADTLLDLVHLSQEQNLLLRELHRALTTRTAQVPRTRLITAQRSPLDPDAESREASRRPPAGGDRVWRMTRPMLERRLQVQEDRKLHPDRYRDPATAVPQPNPEPPTPRTP